MELNDPNQRKPFPELPEDRIRPIFPLLKRIAESVFHWQREIADVKAACINKVGTVFSTNRQFIFYLKERVVIETTKESKRGR